MYLMSWDAYLPGGSAFSLNNPFDLIQPILQIYCPRLKRFSTGLEWLSMIDTALETKADRLNLRGGPQWTTGRISWCAGPGSPSHNSKAPQLVQDHYFLRGCHQFGGAQMTEIFFERHSLRQAI